MLSRVLSVLGLLALSAGCGSDDSDWLTIDHKELIPGVVGSIVTDIAGARAYVCTGSSLVTVDLASQAATRQVSLPDDTTFTLVDAIDSGGSFVAVHTFSEANLIAVSDGAVLATIRATGIGRTTLANGWWYLPVANERRVIAVRFDGSDQTDIPLSASNAPSMRALPKITAASPDGAIVVVDDPTRSSLQVIDTATNTLRPQRFVIGFTVVALAVPDRETAIAVGQGTLAVVDLSDPYAIPTLITVPFLDDLRSDETFGSRSLVAFNSSRTGFIAAAVPDDGPFDDMELGVVDAATGRVSRRTLVPLNPGTGFHSIAVTADDQAVLYGSGTDLFFIRAAAPF